MSIETLDREFLISENDKLNNSEFVLVGPDQTLTASDVSGRVDVGDGEPLHVVAKRAGELLRAQERAPVLVGAVPFNESAGVRLAMVRDVRRRPTMPRDGAKAAPLRVDLRRVDLVPWPGRYIDSVRRVLEQMSAATLRKVVLARAIDLIAAEPVQPADVIRSLAVGEPDAYVFASRIGGHRVVVGASPELVVRKVGHSVVANPVTGFLSRSADRGQVDELSTSDEELQEHRIAVDAVADALRPYCSVLHVSPRPSVIRTQTMRHLSTEVRGVLAAPEPNSLELAAALHPTPAVCGWPAAAARRVIARSENFDRRYYGGLVGWMNADGDGEWVLAQRCAEIAQNRLRLYAGAGVVPGSDPDAELAETSAMFQTFMSALGVDYAVVEEAALGSGTIVARQKGVAC